MRRGIYEEGSYLGQGGIWQRQTTQNTQMTTRQEIDKRVMVVGANAKQILAPVLAEWPRAADGTDTLRDEGERSRPGRHSPRRIRKYLSAPVQRPESRGELRRDRRDGHDVFYGDAADPTFLEACGLAKAAGVVITIHTQRTIDDVVEHVRALRPDILIVSRARDAAHASHLYRLGATDAVPETIEASLQLSEAALIGFGKAAGSIIASIHEKRDEIRRALQQAAREAGLETIHSVRRRRREIPEFPTVPPRSEIRHGGIQIKCERDKARAPRGSADCAPARTDRRGAGRPACRGPAASNRASRSAD